MRSIVVFAIALLAGICGCLLLPSPPGVGALVSVSLVGMLAWRRLPWLAVACFGAVLAGAQVDLALSRRLPASMEQGEAELRGTVIGMPVHEPRRTRFDFDVDDARDMPSALRGRRLRLAWYDDFGAKAPEPDAPRLQVSAGSRWSLAAKLRAPRGLRNPGGVDGEQYALVDRIAATGYLRHTDTARRLAGPVGMDAWRERMSARIARAVPGASSRFVRALALGDTRALGDADWATLRASGLTHLIAISGSHVGMVGAAFALLVRGLWWLWPALARRWPRPQAMLLAAFGGALLYAGVVGFALPTVRTVLMIGVLAVARQLRRSLSAPAAVAVSLLAVLALDPLSVLSAGFWLSFAGVAWLLWCLPRGSGRWWRDMLSAQGVATVGLAPLTVVLFGQGWLAGPLANLVAIPWWSFVVVPLSLLGTLLDVVHTGWGDPLWRLAAAAFDPSWRLFAWLAHGELSLWWLPEAAWFALPLALLAVFWCLLPRGIPGKPLALLLLLPLLWPDRRLPARGEAELVVIDVGQGLSVLVRTRHHQLLFDMGPAVEDGFDAGERAVVPTLHALGVPALDATVVSHGDNDHVGGFASVAGEFRIARRYAPEGSGLVPKIGDFRACRAGANWMWDGVRFRFLHPPPDFPYLKNESSCVLRVETAHGAALLTGDIGQVIERDLLRRDPDAIRADIVVVAHHGSDGSSAPGFVAATGARIAPISAGYGNRFHHPKPDVVALWQAQGALTPVTAEAGALRLRLEAGGVRLSTERCRHRRLWDAAQWVTHQANDPGRDPAHGQARAAGLCYVPD